MATTTQNQFKTIPAARKAEKRQVKLKLGIQGPSGSGKTWGALALAKNLWPDAKVLVVDTENESASLYADNFSFDTIPLDPPFESVRYESCIDYAVENKYDVLILDSVTHQWDGEGGILRRKEELDRRPGANSWTNWAHFTPEHTAFVEAIKQAPIHIIATLRSKQDYVLEQNSKGKQVPVKMGMAPIQRDGFDYEFTLVFDVQMDHKATVIKNRTGLFGDKVLNIADKKVAEAMRTWLDAGKAVEVSPVAAPAVAPKPVIPAPKAPAPKAAPQAVAAEMEPCQCGHPSGIHGYGWGDCTSPNCACTGFKKPVASAPKATAKVDAWKLDGDHLHCHVYDVLSKVSKKGAAFLAVKHNGQVNGKDIAFCFNERMFDAVKAAKGKNCVLFVSPGDYTTIEDVISVGDMEYRDGALYTKPPEQMNIHNVVIEDSDLPF